MPITVMAATAPPKLPTTHDHHMDGNVVATAPDVMTSSAAFLLFVAVSLGLLIKKAAIIP